MTLDERKRVVRAGYDELAPLEHEVAFLWALRE